MAPKKIVNAAAPAATSEVVEPSAAASTEVAAVAAGEEVAAVAVAVPTNAERVTSSLDNLSNTIDTMAKTFAAAFKDMAATIKAIKRDVAALQKEKRGRKSAGAASATTAGGAPRKPSGFAKPALLTSDLCDFLGVPAQTLMARTDVTRLITKYVKDNKLHNEADRRTIQPDGKLLKLLALKAEDKLTYFNLQSHIKHHFIKDVPAVVAPAVTA